MKFFVPFSMNDQQAERIRNRVAQRLTGLGYLPLPDRVYQLVFRSDSQLITNTIGHKCPLAQEIVLLIFKDEAGYLVCSYNRGVTHGRPALASKEAVVSVTTFEEPA